MLPLSPEECRFERLARLYGQPALLRLRDARVVVFGVGGVGSFAAEALTRCAIGHLELVDFDNVCITNSNRQLPALCDTVGRPKAEVMAERLSRINPEARIVARCERYDAERSTALLSPQDGGTYDFVLDCIDNLTAKAHLLAACRARALPVVASMGAGGKRDPSRIRVCDLAETRVCRLARELRKILRQHHGLPRDGPMEIPAVYSDEPRSWPRRVDGTQAGDGPRALIDGTAVFVTGAFGLTCAGHVINSLVAGLIEHAEAAEPQNN